MDFVTPIKEITNLEQYLTHYLIQYLTQYNWKNIKNEYNHLIYTKITDETTYVEIKIENNIIIISIPIKNSIYQYKTKHYNLLHACDYIEDRLYEYDYLT